MKPRLSKGIYVDPIIGLVWSGVWFCSAEKDGSRCSVGSSPQSAYEQWLKNHAWRYDKDRSWWKFWK